MFFINTPKQYYVEQVLLDFSVLYISTTTYDLVKMYFKFS